MLVRRETKSESRRFKEAPLSGSFVEPFPSAFCPSYLRNSLSKKCVIAQNRSTSPAGHVGRRRVVQHVGDDRRGFIAAICAASSIFPGRGARSVCGSAPVACVVTINIVASKFLQSGQRLLRRGDGVRPGCAIHSAVSASYWVAKAVPG